MFPAKNEVGNVRRDVERNVTNIGTPYIGIQRLVERQYKGKNVKRVLSPSRPAQIHRALHGTYEISEEASSKARPLTTFGEADHGDQVLKSIKHRNGQTSKNITAILTMSIQS